MVPFNSLWVAPRAHRIIERKPAMPAPKIITTNVFPPIPMRAFDWSAHFENREEGPYGFGATEAEAVSDLTDNYDNPDQE